MGKHSAEKRKAHLKKYTAAKRGKKRCQKVKTTTSADEVSSSSGEAHAVENQGVHSAEIADGSEDLFACSSEPSSKRTKKSDESETCQKICRDKYCSIQPCACNSGKDFCHWCQDPLYRERYVYNDAATRYHSLTRKYSRSCECAVCIHAAASAGL